MKYLNHIFIIMILILTNNVSAQEGEKLFKSKCNTCHTLGKDGTGPNLKGVKAKWEEAGEGDLIYDWVKNPDGLIALGTSSMANAIKDYSPTSMTAQDLNKEQVDAVLAYVDAWEPAAIDNTPTPTDPNNLEVVYVPNYERNLSMFYFLLILLGVQITAILMIGGSTKMLLKSELLNKIKDKSAVILALVGAFGVLMLNNTTLALEFVSPGMAEDNSPWLLVDDKDVMFMVILNLIALGGLFYMRKSFMDMLKLLRPHALEKKKKEKRSRVNKVLTDAVPIEEEASILMHHEYDGIRELDNNLPPWWLWGFYATIVFAVIYIFNYHILKTSDLQIEAYNKEVAQAEIEIAAYKDKMAMNVDENNVELLTDAKGISAGKAIFAERCVSCHKPDGGGDIGPNLTDKNWIYGFDIKTVFSTIKYGTGRKGMPEHESKLNPIQLQQVASFVLSMPEAKGKEPDGEFIEE